MFIKHRNVETRKVIHIIDTNDSGNAITEVSIMLPNGREVRLWDGPDDGFDIMTSLGRTVIEPQSSNWTRITFKEPEQ